MNTVCIENAVRTVERREREWLTGNYWSDSSSTTHSVRFLLFNCLTREDPKWFYVSFNKLSLPNQSLWYLINFCPQHYIVIILLLMSQHGKTEMFRKSQTWLWAQSRISSQNFLINPYLFHVTMKTQYNCYAPIDEIIEPRVLAF